MASAADTTEAQLSAAFERLATNRDFSLLLPFLLGLAAADRETLAAANSNHDRIILVNPFTQGMVVIDGGDFPAKSGQPPASKASVEAMPTVEIGGDGGECSICLEEWGGDRTVKEMPCKHKFHGECIEKWLGMHGSCPVCRFQMPADKEEGGERSGSQREIWVSFYFGRDRRNGDEDQTSSDDDSESS